MGWDPYIKQTPASIWFWHYYLITLITEKLCFQKLTGHFDINFSSTSPSLISLCTNRLVNLEIHWLHGTSSSLKERPEYFDLWFCDYVIVLACSSSFLSSTFLNEVLFLKRKKKWLSLSLLSKHHQQITVENLTSIQTLLGHRKAHCPCFEEAHEVILNSVLNWHNKYILLCNPLSTCICVNVLKRFIMYYW